jgi:hypothetical protein
MTSVDAAVVPSNFDPGSPVAYRLFEKVVRDFHEVVLDADPTSDRNRIFASEQPEFLRKIGQRHVGQVGRLTRIS